MPKKKHIHLIGVCGTAMASLAGMLQAKGHRVTGSDMAAYPPMSDFLRELGILIAEPFSERNLDPAPDLVIVGNALSRGNPEIEYVLDRRIPFTSLAQIIHDEFIPGMNRLLSPAPTARPPQPACWRGSMRSRDGSARSLRLRS